MTTATKKATRRRERERPRLLTAAQVIEQLGVGKTTFYRHLAALKARGLREVVVGQRRGEAAIGNASIVRYEAASVERLVRRAAKEGRLC